MENHRKTLSIENAVFTSEYPCEEGHYLVKYDLTGEINLLYIYYTLPDVVYGSGWEGRYALHGRGRNVRQLQGKFCKVEFNP